jgi:hypothetical protein
VVVDPSTMPASAPSRSPSGNLPTRIAINPGVVWIG